MITLILDTKRCMSVLLLRDDFDSYALIESEITTFNTFSIDGRIHNAFYDEAPDEEFSYWGSLREHCFSIIKGKRTPLSFKIVLSLPRADFPALIEEQGLSYRPEDLQGLYLNLRYDGTTLSCTTGTSMHTFNMDKSLDTAWDTYVQRFMHSCEIPCEMA